MLLYRKTSIYLAELLKRLQIWDKKKHIVLGEIFWSIFRQEFPRKGFPANFRDPANLLSRNIEQSEGLQGVWRWTARSPPMCDADVCRIVCGSCICLFLFGMTIGTISSRAEAHNIAKQNAKLEENRGTCYGEFGYKNRDGTRTINTGLQNMDCACPTNNTCTWSHDGVCDDVKMKDNGVCAEGTDCADCGTCNWHRCVHKVEVPKPTNQVPKCEYTYATLGMRTFYVCESTHGRCS
jgi:hypothetical protein